ncbi:MAG: phosphoribosylanthranilate isomerase [Vicinamibacterales bacterium]|nr:phosphoribosylanthranilate isomerase [Vicinamibacterales bacterium]
MFVKICGITRLEDADLAVELGANALGFVFWQGSPRAISESTAREIARRHAGHVRNVGVFVDQSLEEVTRAMDVVGLDVAQLHGGESAEYCRLLNRPVIKAVGLQDGEPVALDGFDPEMLILLDAHDPSRYGGTGRTVNWEAAREIAAVRKTILSGGLTPENIVRAVETVQPFGVDVSSGVEAAPGVKDPSRLRRFFEALND